MTTRECVEWAIAASKGNEAVTWERLANTFWISERMEREAATFAAKIALKERVPAFWERNL